MMLLKVIQYLVDWYFANVPFGTLSRADFLTLSGKQWLLMAKGFSIREVTSFKALHPSKT